MQALYIENKNKIHYEYACKNFNQQTNDNQFEIKKQLQINRQQNDKKL